MRVGPEGATYEVTVPPGLGAGEKFAACLSGQLTEVTVPDGVGSRGIVHVQIQRLGQGPDVEVASEHVEAGQRGGRGGERSAAAPGGIRSRLRGARIYLDTSSESSQAAMVSYPSIDKKT